MRDKPVRDELIEHHCRTLMTLWNVAVRATYQAAIAVTTTGSPIN